MKALDIFNKLFDKAAWYTSKNATRRPNANKGKPGEFLDYLSFEERQILSNLSSNDLSQEKIPRGNIEITVYPDSYSWQLKSFEDDCSKMKIEFDKKIIKY